MTSELEDISNSKIKMQHIDMSTLFGAEAEEMNERLFIDSLPQGTKRIQVKGFMCAKRDATSFVYVSTI